MKTILIIVLCLFLSGCGNENFTQTDNKPKKVQVYPATLEEKEHLAVTKNVYAEVDIPYETLGDAADASDYVVYGEIKSVSYSVTDGVITTIEEFEVIDCYRGNASPGDIITIGKDGGFVTVKNYLGSFTHESDIEFQNAVFAELTEEEKENMYIEQLFGNSIHSQPGERRVYCLIPSGTYEETGHYTPTMYSKTSFIEVEGNTFYMEKSLSIIQEGETTYSMYNNGDDVNAEIDIESYGLDLNDVLNKLQVE